MAHHVISPRGKKVTVRDIIRLTSHVAGSIHYDPKPKPEHEILDAFSKRLSVGGLPAGIRMLRAITRVSLRGLQPLIEDVRVRYAP
ncbi:hypothetical protein [Mesorhizobium sp. L48C026A00]|uniref:hypothetical protein n=1 Tax=Mesorhizobium sp. L48C026A00 TaxID=1287182 RepID=UPI0012EB0E5C|nr:hypothetical protein [Mesorhizobium sp. L48C026A00]